MTKPHKYENKMSFLLFVIYNSSQVRAEGKTLIPMYKSKSRTRADPSNHSLKNQTQTEIQMMNSISRQISNEGFLNLHSSNIR